MDIIPQKRCTTCQNSFPATPEFFHRCSRRIDGLKSICKSCRKAEHRQRRRYPEIRAYPVLSCEEKRCTSCQELFPGTLEFFHRNAIMKDGLNARCKKCIKVYQNTPGIRERILEQNKSYHELHKEYERERAKVYNQRPEVRARNKIRERSRSPKRREWRKEYRNRPDVQARIRSYMPIYREEYNQRPEVRAWRREYSKRYVEIHKERHRELGRIQQHIRRARKRAIPGTHTAEQIQDLLKRQRYRCYYCQNKFEKRKGHYVYHIDHTFPIHRVVGTDIPANDISYLVLACPVCNQSKHDRFPWEFPEGGRLL